MIFWEKKAPKSKRHAFYLQRYRQLGAHVQLNTHQFLLCCDSLYSNHKKIAKEHNINFFLISSRLIARYSVPDIAIHWGTTENNKQKTKKTNKSTTHRDTINDACLLLQAGRHGVLHLSGSNVLPLPLVRVPGAVPEVQVAELVRHQDVPGHEGRVTLAEHVAD